MSTTRIRVGVLALAFAAVAALGACGTSDDTAESGAGTAGTAATAASDSATTSAPDSDAITVTIAGGEVSPRNAQIDATVGEPIVLYVTSDAADELHVHATPEHSFEVSAGANRERFEFTPEVPGSVAIELHEAHVTVATISVR